MGRKINNLVDRRKPVDSTIDREKPKQLPRQFMATLAKWTIQIEKACCERKFGHWERRTMAKTKTGILFLEQRP